MTRWTTTLLIATMTLAGCGGRFSDSGWNPLGWFGSTPEPENLAPAEGYAAAQDLRPGIPVVTGASWQRLNEGRLLVVTGMAPTKGHYDAALIASSPAPAGRLRPDADGTLRLRFVARPPLQGSAYATMPATPQADSITTALAISGNVLAAITRIEIAGATNAITIAK